MKDLNPFTQQSQALWIWPASIRQANQYIQFRQEFNLQQVAKDSQIFISADTSYALWLNGQFVQCGKFPDWPSEKSYDTLPISQYLKAGRNVLCVLVYYQGEGSFQYVPSQPGLIYKLTSGVQSVVSGFDTFWRKDPAYRSEGVPRITLQLHFAFEYDCQKADDWLAEGYAPDATWQRIQKQDAHSAINNKTFYARAVKPVHIKERLISKIITQGIFKQSINGQTVAQQMQYAFLSYRDAAEIFGKKSAGFPVILKPPSSDQEGIYLIFDLGREEVGLFEIEIEANAGTVVDVAYGEHLEDLRVRAFVGGRHFADRFIAKQGRQIFTHYFTRFAGRYLQLHIHRFRTDCILHYAGLRPVEYPIEEKSVFSSSCHLQESIYKTAIRTLRLSMHEHYEDCPWREQALYANDARNQALCGYYCFGEYAFPAACFDLLGKGLKADGFLELCAPADIPITIPSFSLVWILAVRDYLLYSGDMSYVAKQFPVVKKIIDTQIARMREGLLPCPQGARYWQFYDWADGLDGTIMGDCTKFAVVKGLRYDAPLNMFFCLALEAAAMMARYVGDLLSAEQYSGVLVSLKKTIHEHFFDVKAKRYKTFIGETDKPYHYTELSQSLAILADIAQHDLADTLRRALAANNDDLVPTTLSQSLYKFEALLTDKINFGQYVFNKINNDWGSMLFKGASSFWETLNGASDFDGAGSLCHGWSAIPIYLFYAHLMGIRPVEPGFKQFIFEPVLSVVGVHRSDVFTPSGTIRVYLQRAEHHLDGQLAYPAHLELVAKPELRQKIRMERY